MSPLASPHAAKSTRRFAHLRRLRFQDGDLAIPQAALAKRPVETRSTCSLSNASVVATLLPT
jgi:hypothetical protein